MTQPFELVPHVDQNDHLLGQVTRLEAYEKGLIHRAAHGIIQNAQGQYLVQQRSFQKATWPGYYDLGIAETVKPDEGYQAALQRGLHEELSVTTYKLELIREKYYQEYFWEEYRVFGVICLFRVQTDETPQLKDGEVEKVEWRTQAEIDTLTNHEVETCTPWLLHDWQFYRQNFSL